MHRRKLTKVKILAALLLLPAQTASAVEISAGVSPERLRQTRGKREQAAQYARARQISASTWQKCIGRAVSDLHQHGAGGYSTHDDAHDALSRAFEWDTRLQQPIFHTESARPSFCSGAVYAVIISALLHWDRENTPHRISPEAWQALLPHRAPDGVGAWGQANANGPGLAVLVHRLGAGINFTDWAKARPGDILKMWWTDAVGATERGHLVIFVKDLGDEIVTWSSHQGGKDSAGGFGFKRFRKKDAIHVLFTRIINPRAFNNAPKLGTDEWLASLLQRTVTWKECLLRTGILTTRQ